MIFQALLISYIVKSIYMTNKSTKPDYPCDFGLWICYRYTSIYAKKLPKRLNVTPCMKFILLYDFDYD